MRIQAPKVISIPQRGIWTGRENVRGIFLKRHDLKENAGALEVEVRNGLSNVSLRNLLFLVEGINHSYSQEVLFARNFVNENQIEAKDPIVNPFSNGIAKKVSIEPVHGALSRLVLDYLAFGDNDLSLAKETTPDELIRFSVEAVAREFGISSTNLRRQFSTLSFQDGQRLGEEIDFLVKIRQKLVDVSNNLSREQLEKMLDIRRQPNILIMAGNAHEGVFVEGAERGLVADTRGFDQQFNLQSLPIEVNDGMLSQLRSNPKLRNVEILAAGEYLPNPARSQLNHFWGMHDRCKTDPHWETFLYLLNPDETNDKKCFYFLSFEIRTLNMLSIIEKIPPRPLPNDEQYSRSNLIDWATTNPEEIFPRPKWFFDTRRDFRYITREGTINSAKILRIIVEKIGNSLPDEADILQQLLIAPLPEVRDEGVKALSSASKHNWRNNPDEVWKLVNVLPLQIPKRRRQIELAIVSANPRFLFAKDGDDRFIIYKGKDAEIEQRLIACAQDSDPEARTNAYLVIGSYLKRHHIESPVLDGILIRRLESNEYTSLYALVERLRRSFIQDPRLLMLLKRAAMDSNQQNRCNALNAIGRYLNKVKVDDSELKVIARGNFGHEYEHVRVGATDVFGLVISGEPVLEVQDGDISALLQIANNDSNKLARSNATCALAVVVNRNLDLIPEEKLDQVEHACAVNRDPEVASQEELKTINEAFDRLVMMSGLKDVSLLFELEGNPSKPKVEQLIKKKDRYRDAIGPLLARIEALYQANLELVACVEALKDENFALKEEGRLLRNRIIELTQELNRIEASIRSNRIKRILMSIGGTAFRNIIKGRGVAHAEFAKSIFIDAGWNQALEFLI